MWLLAAATPYAPATSGEEFSASSVAKGPLFRNHPAVFASAVPSTPACPESAPAPVSPHTPAFPLPDPVWLVVNDTPTTPELGLCPATPKAPALLVTPTTPLPVDVAVTVPLTFWFPVNELAVASCGILVISRLSVTLPLAPPPVRSVPAVTPVMVPVPALAQAHAPPMNSKT